VRDRIIKTVILSLMIGGLMIGLHIQGMPDLMAQTPATLYWGSYGDDVRVVQEKLRNWGYYDGPIDSYYGASTWNAVRDFQRRNGLTVDGVVGRQTWAALGVWIPETRAAAGWGQQQTQAAAPRQGTTGISSSDELNLLARLVAGEAEGEPYQGQVAVAAVILNRIKSSSFPNTLSGVVYQPKAFESVSNGQIWRVQDLSTATRAAQDALNGWDPTQGALFFWNPYKPVSKWIWTRTIITQIGRHVFGI